MCLNKKTIHYLYYSFVILLLVGLIFKSYFQVVNISTTRNNQYSSQLYLLPYGIFKGYTFSQVSNFNWIFEIRVINFKENFYLIKPSFSLPFNNLKFIKNIKYELIDNYHRLNSLNIKIKLPKTKIKYHFSLYKGTQGDTKIIFIDTLDENKIQRGVWGYIVIY